MRFSTAELKEADKLERSREHYWRIGFKLDFEPAPGATFEVAVAARSLPGVKLLSTRMTPGRILRTHEHIATDNDDHVFVINQTSEATIVSRGREVVLGVGDAILMSSAETKTYNRHGFGGDTALRIPRSVLASIVPHVDDVVMHAISHHVGVLKLLDSYAVSVLNDVSLSTPEVRRAAVNHLHDLVALALGATHDASNLAIGRGLPAARLRMAKTYIIENSNRRDLSVGGVAAHLGLTARNLQRLFESEGTTFSEFLLSQRLSRAHRMLTESQHTQNPVGSIAYDAGFGDLSYFNRSFKRRYGATPRDIRKGTEESSDVATGS